MAERPTDRRQKSYRFIFLTVLVVAAASPVSNALSSRSASSARPRNASVRPVALPDLKMVPREGGAQCADAKLVPSRRTFLIQSSDALTASVLFLSPAAGNAVEGTAEPPTTAPTTPELFIRRSEKPRFGYTLTPPPGLVAGSKPLKTHIDETNFSSATLRGYAVGVTVDPVRISSIREFGTPEEVAARVVTAEVNRDGVFDVMLAKDPVEDVNSGGCYDIEYISKGKRGTKRSVTRIFIRDGFLYVLTAQSKESDYDKEREREILVCVKSFRPL